MSSSYRCWFRFLYFFLAKASLFVLGLVLSVLSLGLFWEFGSQYQCNQLPGKTHLQTDLLCVECDIKFYSLTVIVSIWWGRSVQSRNAMYWSCTNCLFFFILSCMINNILYILKPHNHVIWKCNFAALSNLPGNLLICSCTWQNRSLSSAWSMSFWFLQTAGLVRVGVFREVHVIN